MMRILAAFLAASLAAQIFLPAVCASAQAAATFEAGTDVAPPAAGPFEVVPQESPPDGTHRLAWASLLTGAGLVGLSFALTDRANQSYDDYLVATDPGRAEHLYDRATRYDRLSAASLLAGEALVASAVWLRFIRPRPAPRLTLVAEPDRCAVALRF
jgi:hypothetical protein